MVGSLETCLIDSTNLYRSVPCQDVTTLTKRVVLHVKPTCLAKLLGSPIGKRLCSSLFGTHTSFATCLLLSSSCREGGIMYHLAIDIGGPAYSQHRSLLQRCPWCPSAQQLDTYTTATLATFNTPKARQVDTGLSIVLHGIR